MEFTTIYGGLEPNSDVVPALQATWLSELIPWNRFPGLLKSFKNSGSEFESIPGTESGIE
jgi:hypothetical protein